MFCMDNCACTLSTLFDPADVCLCCGAMLLIFILPNFSYTHPQMFKFQVTNKTSV